MGLPEILTVAGLLAGGLGIALLGSVKLALARKRYDQAVRYVGQLVRVNPRSNYAAELPSSRVYDFSVYFHTNGFFI